MYYREFFFLTKTWSNCNQFTFSLFFFVVPPSVPIIYNEQNEPIELRAGPYEESGQLILTCVVVGGKIFPKMPKLLLKTQGQVELNWTIKPNVCGHISHVWALISQKINKIDYLPTLWALKFNMCNCIKSKNITVKNLKKSMKYNKM